MLPNKATTRVYEDTKHEGTLKILTNLKNNNNGAKKALKIPFKVSWLK